MFTPFMRTVSFKAVILSQFTGIIISLGNLFSHRKGIKPIVKATLLLTESLSSKLVVHILAQN